MPLPPIPNRAQIRSVLLAVLLALGGPALARDHAVSPGDDIAELLHGGQVRPGDRLILKDGSYGGLKIRNVYFKAPVEIRAENAGKAVFHGIYIDKSRNLTLHGLSAWEHKADNERVLVMAGRQSEDIRFVGLDVRGHPDAPGTYQGWSAKDWKTWAASGVRLYGVRNALVDSTITATSFAITANNSHAEIIGNRVEGFSGDAIRALGDHARVIGNRVRDCVKINGNHDDGFQSWAGKDKDGKIRAQRDLVLRDNVIVEWTGPRDAPLRCSLQGIALFDGPYDGVEIVNNIIAVSAYHGIAVYGGQNGRVTHNTVVTPDGMPAKSPWILVRDSKNGKVKPENMVVSNNIAMALKGLAAKSRSNAVSRYPARVFLDPLNFDYRIRPDGPLAGLDMGAHVP